MHYEANIWHKGIIYGYKEYSLLRMSKIKKGFFLNHPKEHTQKIKDLSTDHPTLKKEKDNSTQQREMKCQLYRLEKCGSK